MHSIILLVQLHVLFILKIHRIFLYVYVLLIVQKLGLQDNLLLTKDGSNSLFFVDVTFGNTIRLEGCTRGRLAGCFGKLKFLFQNCWFDWCCVLVPCRFLIVKLKGLVLLNYDHLLKAGTPLITACGGFSLFRGNLGCYCLCSDFLLFKFRQI